jgi:hypothetical protein
MEDESGYMSWVSGYRVTRGWIGEVWVLALMFDAALASLHYCIKVCLPVCLCLSNNAVLQQAMSYAREADRSGAGEGEG